MVSVAGSYVNYQAASLSYITGESGTRVQMMPEMLGLTILRGARMYKTVLVDADIDDGRRVVAALEKAGLKMTAAFWFHPEDEDEWNLVIISPDVEEKGPRRVYEDVRDLLMNMKTNTPRPERFWWDRIKIIGPSTLIYRRVKQHSGLRFGPVREGPALDAYIYKMT